MERAAELVDGGVESKFPVGFDILEHRLGEVEEELAIVGGWGG